LTDFPVLLVESGRQQFPASGSHRIPMRHPLAALSPCASCSRSILCGACIHRIPVPYPVAAASLCGRKAWGQP
ncbi:MAG: hypothetical protein P8X95_26165, partial [Anaerolineales bacterium]